MQLQEKSSNRRIKTGQEDPNPEYVSIYCKELLESIIPYTRLLNNEEQRKYLKMLEKDAKLRDEIAEFLVKAHNDQLRFRGDILDERKEFIKDNWSDSRVFNVSTREEIMEYQKQQEELKEQKILSKMSPLKRAKRIRMKQKSSKQLIENMEEFYRNKRKTLREEHDRENLEF